MAVVFLALGIGAAAGWSAWSGRGGTSPATASTAEVAPADTVAVTAPVDDIDAPQGPAREPETAVAQFLAAEQRRDYAGSYGRLAASNRENIGTMPQWVNAHDEMPRVTGWQLQGVAEAGPGAATVTGTLALQPTLDEVGGLVPGTATASWAAVEQDGEWFVDYDESSVLARYPSDEDAAQAVLEWAQARQRCEASGEYDGGLLGQRRLADTLCEADGSVETAAARELETPELDVLLPPFGAEAEVWGRAVDVTAPVALRALVAPLGSDWIVVGVLPPAP